MLTSRRDYILRLIDEVSRLLARVVFKRCGGRDQEALEGIVQACERLFGIESDKLFQFTPEQHFAMLTADEAPEVARQKVLIYAALNAEAGRVYRKLGNRALARATFLTALRLRLRADIEFPAANDPEFAPSLRDLLETLQDEPLDHETATLLAAATKPRL
jgi:hypothetical protein